MPIYEYECTKCGLIEEAFQKMSEKPLTRCTECSGKLRKLISNSAFHLKGTGWYVTDYANKAGKKDSKPATSSSPKDTKPSSTPEKSSTSTDSK